MKKIPLLSLVVALAVPVGLVTIARFPLVAGAADVPASLETVKERMEQLDRQLSEVKSAVAGVKKRGEELKESITAKTKQVQMLVEDPTKLSDELKKRVELFQSGEEQKQLEALKESEKLASRDEVVLVCGRVAKDSPHESVRRRALMAAVSLGEDGYTAIALAYEGLGGKDRIFLAQELAKRNSPDNVVFFAFMTKDANEELLKTLLNVELPPSQLILFLSGIAEAQMNDDFYDHVVAVGSRMEGDPGLLLLYAMAKK
ncbi:MAG: hypothetical protein ACKOUR_08170, partial [Planctomycetota bacterium]